MRRSIAALCRRLTLGVYVVGVAHEGKRDAFTAAAVAPASYRPLVLSLAINPEHHSYGLLRDGKTFTVSVLARHQIDLATRFGTSRACAQDKLAGVDWYPGRHGAPILTDAIAFLECLVAGQMNAGDHRIVLGRVVHGDLVNRRAPPMTYAETGNLDGSMDLYPSSFADG
jgi:flavin reductase (DIM6/NTAB) family NADH-FMN oxidoreductase RutF